MPIVVANDRCAQRWHAGEGRLTANHAQVDRGTERTAPSARHDPAAQAARAQGASGPLMFLVAALFAGSALLSLTLLWFAARGLRWLLLHG